jgi:glycerol-3-phosphate cytidylyltransferase
MTISQPFESISKQIIITYGTFDMFHIGHLNLLKRLKALGGKLIVAVSTDDFNKLKGKRTLIPFAQRKEIVAAIREVDMVIPEESWEQKISDIQKYGVTTFAIGDDWQGKFDFLSDYCEVKYLERTDGISSTELKNTLKNFSAIPREDLLKAFEVLEALKRDFE